MEFIDINLESTKTLKAAKSIYDANTIDKAIGRIANGDLDKAVEDSETAAKAAVASASAAKESQRLAGVAATEAEQSSIAARGSAEQAKLSETASLQHKLDAEQAASTAAEDAAQKTEESIRAEMQGYVTDANASKVDAADSASKAQVSEDAAKASEEEATRKAKEAVIHRDAAEGSATDASYSEDNAKKSADAAQDALESIQGGLAGKLDVSRAAPLLRDLTADGNGVLTVTSLDGTQKRVDPGVSQRILADETGNASQVRFNDGISMQDKLDVGDLNGKDGVVVATSGFFALNVNSYGHLVVTVTDDAEFPPIRIDDNGHLIYTI